MKGISTLKRVLCLVLCLFTVVACFAGCSDDGGEEDDTGKQQMTVTGSMDPSEICDLPEDLDFEGREVTMLVEHEDSQENEFYLGEEPKKTGELIPDAAFDRNVAVESQLNIKLKPIPGEGYINDVHIKDFQAGSGDSEYDIIADRVTNKGVLIASGYYYNLNDLDHINFEKKYWSQGFGEVLTFGKENKQYLATGPLALSMYRLMFATIYNQELLEDYNIADPYDIVMAGEWTIDAQLSMIKDRFEEKDNETGKTEGDFYGLITGSNISMDPYLVSSGVELIKKNPDTYDWEYNSEGNSYFIDVATKVQALSTNDATFLFETSKDVPASNDIMIKFGREEGLMATMMFHSLEKNMNEVKFDYGIAPIPKYSADKPYYTYIQDQMTSIGVNAAIATDKLEMIGAALESIAYQSSIYIQDAYFEKAMNLRFLKDPKTQDIIDILYENVSIDFAGAMSSTFEQFKIRDVLRPILSSNSAVTSTVSGRKTYITRTLKKLNQDIDKLP